MKRNIKIAVDILMLVFLVLSLRRWSGDPMPHIIAGSAFTLAFIAHICLNGRWLISMTKGFGEDRVSPSLTRRYIVDVLLLICWCAVIYTGIFAGTLSRLHGMSARLGCVLIAIHIAQHRKQIASYMKRRKQ